MSCIIQYLLLGSITGLVITLVDWLYPLLLPNGYIPREFILSVFGVNLFFWSALGLLYGLCIQAFFKRYLHYTHDSPYYHLFFLLVFVSVYGFLSKLFVAVTFSWGAGEAPFPFECYIKPGYDYHLSFVMAGVIIAVSFFMLKKKRIALYAVMFPSIVSIALLLPFGSNLATLDRLLHLSQRVDSIIPLSREHLLIVMYAVGTCAIFILYFILLLCLKRIGKIRNTGYILFSVLLFVVTAAGVAVLIHTDNVISGGDAGSVTKVSAKKPPYVFLIVLDTVRADRLSLYGGPCRVKNLERFAEDALVFKNCLASSAWTQPSHASLFTGLYPVEHGTHGRLDKEPSWGFFPTSPLHDSFATLAEIFKDNGYRTAAVVANAMQLHEGTALDQGFEAYDCRQNIGRFYTYPFKPILYLFSYLTNINIKYTLPCRTAEDINKKVREQIERSAPAPFFVFINYMDAHSPYRPPRPYDGMSTGHPFPQIMNMMKYCAWLAGSVSEGEWSAFIRSKYDEEIMYLDHQLGALFNHLKKCGIYDSSLIVVTSDHGEHFGEHGCYGHMTPMYQQTLHVPLLIKVPFSKKTGKVVARVTLSDVFATIVSLCSLPITHEISGTFFGKKKGTIVSEFYSYEFGKHRAVYDGHYKYMTYGKKRGLEYMKMRYGHKQDPELYNIKDDPAEQENIAGSSPVAQEMERLLQEWEAKHRPLYAQQDRVKEQGKISEDMLDGLKALGYVQ